MLRRVEILGRNAYTKRRLRSHFSSAGSITAINEALLAGGRIISVQVLNEFVAISCRKLKLAWPEIHEILTTIRAFCEVVPVTVEIHETGLTIAERFNLSFYDSLILAAAEHAGCKVVYSEDMQDDQLVGSMTVRNPF